MCNTRQRAREAELKILYHHRVRSKDGQAVHIGEFVEALRTLGHDVVLVEPPGYRRARFGEEPTALASIKNRVPKFLYELIELAYNVPAYFRLRQAYGRAAPDLIYERYSLYLLAGIWLRLNHGIPLLLEVNSPLAQERATFGGIGLRRAAAFLEAWTWRNADHVLPVTEVLAGKIIAAGVPANRITVVANGINAERFARIADTARAKAELGLGGKLVLGFTGFMREWHRLDSVLDLLASGDVPPELHLLLVGDGPARATLERQAKKLGLDSRVTFAGMVDHREITTFIAAFDIALQPAAIDYASPLKLFEYMAQAKAIVAPNQPNIRETLTHDVDALLFEPGNNAVMASAIARLARDAPLRDRLGNNARTTIIERRMTWTDNARRVVEIGHAISQSRRYKKDGIGLKEAT